MMVGHLTPFVPATAGTKGCRLRTQSKLPLDCRLRGNERPISDAENQMPQLANKVVITCAITGSIHTPTMSEALPIPPDQIATQAIDAAKAGAAILHLHARDPKDGRPSPDPAVFMQFLPRIKQSCDAVINITTGGSVTMTLEDRIAAASKLSPEMCSLNMGSMNFALYPMAARSKTWKYDWEKEYLLQSDKNIFRYTVRDI